MLIARPKNSPAVTSAFGLTVMDSEEKMIGQQIELLTSHRPTTEEMDAYSESSATL